MVDVPTWSMDVRLQMGGSRQGSGSSDPFRGRGVLKNLALIRRPSQVGSTRPETRGMSCTLTYLDLPLPVHITTFTTHIAIYTLHE